MKILLAGYNVDAEVLEELKKNSPQRQDVTPETLSAAYARISRDPRPIDELRKAAREEVEKTRKSNSTIIFKMGHHSVAEHAVFNFDLIGLSRLAVEFIEHFRLCSFTEKSQRYITLGDDHVIPKEIRGSEIRSKYIEILKEQNGLYHRLNEKLRKYVFEKHKGLAADPKNRNLLEGWAKEDARYITSLATEAQLGLTINARNLELFLRRAKSQKLAEIKELAEQMYALVEKIAPSIILFTKANDYDAKTYDEIKSKILNPKSKTNPNPKITNEVILVEHTKDADDILVSSLLYAVSKEPYDSCMAAVKKMSFEEKKELVKASCRHMELYDTALREYENVNFTFDVILSSSCFAQLKRHRMATIIAKDYDTELGVTVPPSIKEIGMEKEFLEVVKKTEDVYNSISMNFNRISAGYVLTNAHRRRVLFSCNARELYHVSRLREDAHAQWDIQNLSRLMSQEAKKAAPLTCLFLGGKDAYSEIRKNNFAS